MDNIDPQAIIILVIMIIGGLRWMYERLKGQQPEDPDQPTSTFEDLYEEARREILERQNRQDSTAEEVGERLEEYSQPTVYVPQPTVAPPPVPAPPPLPRPGPGPKHTRSSETYDYNKPRKQAKPTLTAAEQAALKSLQARRGTGKRRRKAASKSRIYSLLSTPEAARDAIVLREILGPPKGAVSDPLHN